MSMSSMPIIAAAAGGGNFLLNIAPLILIVVVFYFLLIRPQQKRVKEHQAMIASLRKGDTVVTGGGFIGKVTRVGDTEVTVELGDNVRVKVVKGTITEVRAKTEPAKTDDDDDEDDDASTSEPANDDAKSA